jgi:hypothetical protein
LCLRTQVAECCPPAPSGRGLWYIPGIMENFPKKRGRPRKIPDSPLPGVKAPEIPEPAREFFDWSRQSERNRANLYYADRAREVVEALSKKVRMPEDPALAAKLRLGMDWILGRRTVLSELGRMLIEDPTEQDIQRFQDVVSYITTRHSKITAKAAAAHVRRVRLGETGRRDRVAALHHDLNVAINLHRKRFPESSWADVRRALELTTVQIERKLK